MIKPIIITSLLVSIITTNNCMEKAAITKQDKGLTNQMLCEHAILALRGEYLCTQLQSLRYNQSTCDYYITFSTGFEKNIFSANEKTKEKDIFDNWYHCYEKIKGHKRPAEYRDEVSCCGRDKAIEEYTLLRSCRAQNAAWYAIQEELETISPHDSVAINNKIELYKELIKKSELVEQTIDSLHGNPEWDDAFIDTTPDFWDKEAIIVYCDNVFFDIMEIVYQDYITFLEEAVKRFNRLTIKST